MEKELLYEGKKLAIWGLGYIGVSTMANFAAKGVKCIGYDIKSEVVDRINEGKLPYDDTMFYWIGFDTKPLVEKGLMVATNNPNDLFSDDVIAHLICVPTELDGEPWDDALVYVTENITKFYTEKFSQTVGVTKYQIGVIVESTISPDKVNDLINIFKVNGIDVMDEGSGIFLGGAPRRDWFVSSDKNLVNLPRVIGATNDVGTIRMNKLYSIICNTVLEASGMKEACLVKSVENAYRHLDITFANELALAYPNVNIREVLRLASTKWNIGLYHPSLGCAGYCIPLAPRYVLRGATYPLELKLIKAAIETDDRQPSILANKIISSDYKNVGILGLAYTKNLKVDILSPTKRIAKILKDFGLDVRINDPFYSEEEIYNKTECATFKYPDDLDTFDVVIIVDDHNQYRQVPKGIIVEKLKKVKRVWDNVGLFLDLKEQINSDSEKEIYSEIGGANWLNV